MKAMDGGKRLRTDSVRVGVTDCERTCSDGVGVGVGVGVGNAAPGSITRYGAKPSSRDMSDTIVSKSGREYGSTAQHRFASFRKGSGKSNPILLR